MTAPAQLSRVTVEIDGQPAELGLAAPSAGSELALLDADPDADAELARTSQLIAGLVASFDGGPLPPELALALARDPASAAALLELRAELFEDARLKGRVALRCPDCGHDAELGLVAFALALGPNPWPLVDPQLRPTAPALSTLRAPGTRPTGVARAAGARLRLPYAVLGLARPFSEAVVAEPLTEARDAAAWRRLTEPAQRAAWPITHPGACAIVRLAAALDQLDGVRPVAPDLVAAMPVPCFRFADAACWYLHYVDVHDPAAATITCAACRSRFLIVL